MRLPAPRVAATVAAAGALVALAIPAAADAAGVAYLDGKEVWAANLSGTTKLRLSGGEGDWTAVAQSDQGYVVGVRREAGKIFDLSTFAVWDPSGRQLGAGPLVSPAPGATNVYPLSLDLTPDGRRIVYGFSSATIFPTVSRATGFLHITSDTVAQPARLDAIKNTAVSWPTLVGERVIGTPDEQQVSVQDASGVPSRAFVPWFQGAGIFDIHRTDVAATGTVLAVEYWKSDPNTSAPADQRVGVLRVSGLGGSLTGGAECRLPASGQATSPSLLQDATRIAWSDAAGVQVGGVPTFAGSNPDLPCTLTSPAVTISATGSSPSLGAIDVEAIAASRAPVSGGGAAGTGGATGGGAAPGAGAGGPAAGAGTTADPNAPVVDLGRSLKLSALGSKAGATIRVTSPVGGRATVKATVAPRSLGRKGKKAVVIATGKATLKAGKTAKVKLKATKTGQRARKTLKQKQATVTVTVGGRTTTVTTTLK